jgi:hypothetical protein
MTLDSGRGSQHICLPPLSARSHCRLELTMLPAVLRERVSISLQARSWQCFEMTGLAGDAA